MVLIGGYSFGQLNQERGGGFVRLFHESFNELFFGVVFLGEALRKAQWLAVTFAAAGVLWLTISLNALPWVSLTLAISFALYGLIRKVAPASPLKG